MLSDSVKAQSDNKSLEQRIIQSLPKENDTKFLTIAIENDLFASDQDHDYTSGLVGRCLVE